LPTSEKVHVETPLSQALFKLLGELEARLGLTSDVRVYLAGGMATHLYTGHRSTSDIDAEFSERFLVPHDLVIEFDHEDGQRQALYIDTTYNPSFSLMHPDRYQDAEPIKAYTGKFKLFALSAVDLALSKITRLSQIDKEDILSLAMAGLVSSIDLRNRADEALADCIGFPAGLGQNILDAIEIIRAEEQSIEQERHKNSER